MRARTGRIDAPSLTARLREQGFRLSPVDGLPGFLQVEEGPRPVSFTFEHWLGLLYVQQASTGLAAPALAPRPGERVLDLCAAPGGKTTHMAELMGEAGALVASEINEGRIRGLLGNVYRLGHANVLVVAGDGRDFPEEARFDRVLVDAPCSGEGTLRRRGGSPPNQSRAFLRYVTGVQEALLRKAIRVTRPGGTVLYVTCTFAPEENEAVVSRVLDDEPVELEPLELPVDHAPGLTRFEDLRFDGRLVGAARVYPHHLDSGGLFLARLRRLPSSEPPDAGGDWSPVPLVFPGDAMERSRAEELLRVGASSLREHFGVDPGAFDGMSWMVRGGRLWLHGAGAWPVGCWSEGGWRVVSLGLRALEFDTRGRPRPTNDLLQWLDRSVTRSAVDVGDEELARLLAGASVPRPEEMRGLQAIRYRGRVVGRGVPGTEGLRTEIPRARGRDLASCLAGVSP